MARRSNSPVCSQIGKVVFLVDGFDLASLNDPATTVKSRVVDYDFALNFPAFEKQMEEGKGTQAQPIMIKSAISPGFLARVPEVWNDYKKKKYQNCDEYLLDCAIHKHFDGTTPAKMKEMLDVVKELGHPLGELMKKESEFKEEYLAKMSRTLSGACTSTSGWA